MPATSELILEQITILEEKVTRALAAGEDPSALSEQLRVLKEQLVKSADALTEGKSLLKG